MKLELKHLAPYLPYGLKVFLGNTERDLTAVSIDSKFIFVTQWAGSREKQMTDIENVKPILKSLSECTDINSPFLNSINADLPIQMQICDLANKRIGYWNCSYQAINTMCEHHIDIFGLIDAGLAIEKK